MIPFKDRIERYNKLLNKLMLSFRSGDESFIESVIDDISTNGISLSTSQVDFLYHYFSSFNTLPNFYIFFKLIDLKTQLTKSAFNIFYNKHILNNDIKTLDDKTKIILNYYIDKGFMKKKP